MARTKIDYGIDLGTTNSAISRMENGEPTIKKTDTLKDTMPSCVYINKKKAIQVGDSAYNVLKRDKLKAMGTWNSSDDNSFVEFKRTMGTNKTYHSSNFGKDMSSEELSAEVLKTLKSFVKDENINSIVITIPAAFKINQIDATRRAGELAGFKDVEVLQEPVAASMAYGLNTKKKDGFWMVFDFGGGTFDAALLKVEEGIMKVIDTEGDNHLGGKNLDFAIVDEIILPYIQENFVIDSILKDDDKKQILRNAMKFYAEETKIKLSFNETHNILSDLGDIPGKDDEGEEFELDITVSQTDITNALAPIFQHAIDISLDLLERNNLKGASLDSLILVGGPTFSPVLRKMLKEQICIPDTSTDPMTVVSKGAGLYAATIDVSDIVREQTRDKTKIQLEIGHESSTVETEVFVPIKILEDKTEGEIPENIFAEVTRGDNAWSSGKVEINVLGEIIEVHLNKEKTNIFKIVLYDDKGSVLQCEPKEFSIIQGIGGVESMQTLPYNFGIEIKQKGSGRVIFEGIKGLEKNKSLPLVGTRNSLKTQRQIRPGMDSDIIKIPLYQGDHGSEGTRAVYNEHVYDIIIKGTDIPALLPERSDVDLTINIDKSQEVTVQAYFPHLEFTEEIKVPTNTIQKIETTWLADEIKKAKESIVELKKDEDLGADEKTKKVEAEIEQIEKSFKKNKDDVDGKQEVLKKLRKSLKKIDSINQKAEWPKLESELKKEFYKIEKEQTEYGNEKISNQIEDYREQLEEVIKTQDIKTGNILLQDMITFFVQITLVYQYIFHIGEYSKNFDSYSWGDKNRAKILVNKGVQIISKNPSVENLQPIFIELFDMLPEYQKPKDNKDVLEG